MWKSQASPDLAYHLQWPGHGLSGWRKERTVSEPCGQIVHYWCWRVKNRARLWAPQRLEKSILLSPPPPLGKVDQPPSSDPSPGIRAWLLVCRGPQPLGAPLSEDELSEELGELVTLSPSGFQVEASPYRATVDRV